MTKITIEYKQEYVNQMINREIKKRRIKTIATIVDYICRVCVVISIFTFLGSCGAYEVNDFTGWQCILGCTLSAIVFFCGMYAVVWLDELKKRVS